MYSERLDGYSRSAQSIGILNDGSVFADVQWFDDDYGGSASTYFVGPAGVTRIRALLAAEHRAVDRNVDLVHALADKFKATSHLIDWLDAQATRYYRKVDIYGNSDVPTRDRPALTGPVLMSVTQRSESRLISSLSSNAPPSSQVRVAYSPVRYAA